MRRLPLILLMTWCSSGCMTEASGDTTVLVGQDIEVRPRELCSFYGWLGDRHWRATVPYIAPVAGTAVVEGLIDPSLGSGVACSDVDPANPCPELVGDTWVNHLEELHLADGTVELGAYGVAVLERYEDNPAWCEWRAAVRVEN